MAHSSCRKGVGVGANGKRRCIWEADRARPCREVQAGVRSFHFIVITNGSHGKGKETIFCALLQASERTDGRVEGQEQQQEVRKLWQDPAERSH